MSERYARQLALPQVGPAGQQRLARAGVLVVGLGGLGSAATLYLAAAGVGRLGLADPDLVSSSNLNRQVLYAEAHLGKRKVEAAAERLLGLNPGLAVDRYPERLERARLAQVLPGYDLVVDATDNFASRYQINAACRETGKPWVHGAVRGWEGVVTTFLPEGPCFACLYPEPPAEPQRPPVIGVSPGVVGCWQAGEALKLLLGGERPLSGRLLVIDIWQGQVKILSYRQRQDCAGCGRRHGEQDSAPGPAQ